MTRTVSIAEARADFASLVHRVERERQIMITRRGQPVAVLVSLEGFRSAGRVADDDFVAALDEFRESAELAGLGVDPEVFANVRATDEAHEPDL